jgi:hypothetical protein
LGQPADGSDQGAASKRSASCSPSTCRTPSCAAAGRRHHRRRRQRAGLPAADPDSVPVHSGPRRFGLSAARGLPARPPDGYRRPLRPLVHPAAVELCLRHSRHHGGAHDLQLARPAGDDHDRTVDDLFGAPAGLRADHRRVHPGEHGRRRLQFAGAGAVRPLRGRSGERPGGRRGAQADRRQGFAASADARIAVVPLAAPAIC